jgi:hypothetical protein
MSTVRKGQRPGGAALQVDVIALSSAMDAIPVNEGRLKTALDGMMHCAVRPDAEIAAAAPAPTAEPRMRENSRIRLALVTGTDPFKELGPGDSGDPIASAATATPVANPSPSDGSPAAPPEIPFILDVGRGEIGSSGCRILSTLLRHKAAQRLTYLDLSSNVATDLGKEFGPFAELMDAVAELPRLAFLSLHNNLLLGPGCAAVGRVLRKSRSLKFLDLSRCNVGPQGAAELLPAFRRPRPAGWPQSALAIVAEREAKEAEEESKAMGLYDEDEDESEAGTEDASAPRPDYLPPRRPNPRRRRPPTPENPSANTSLVWLDLSENNLCGFGLGDSAPVCDLVSGLLRHPSLKSVDLSRNRLTKEVIARIADNIEPNTSLRSLKLEENGIDAMPSVAVAQSLAGNSTLTHLSLRSNRVRSDGASAFADLLRRSPVVKTLDLRGNYIGDIGQADLRRALEGLPPPPEVTAYGRVATSGLGATALGGHGGPADAVMTGDGDDVDALTGSRPLSAATGDAEGFADSMTDRASTRDDGMMDLDGSGGGGGGGDGGGRGSAMGVGAGASDDAMSLASGTTATGGRGANPGTPTEDSRPGTRATAAEGGRSNAGADGGSGRPAPEPGSLEYYAEMKDDDEDDDDESEGQQQSRAGSARGAPAMPSPTRAAGGGLRAIMALRTDAGPVGAGGGSATATVEGAAALLVQTPTLKVITDADGAWTVEGSGRRVFVVGDDEAMEGLGQGKDK